MRGTSANKPLSSIDTPDVEAAFGAIQNPRPIVLRPIHEIVAEAREPDWLIHNTIERGVLAVLAGPRSSFKSFIALDWAMRIALDGHAVVILSGEGSGLDRRVAAWMNQHRESVDLSTVPLVALERPLNLNSRQELDALRQAIAKLPRLPALIVIDTFSKFSAGLDENDNSQVAAFLSGISRVLREELGCTVILVAHSGHSDAKRPRGASSLMSNPDAEYIVNRPDPSGMTVTVSRERFKDSPSLSPLAYEAKVIDLCRVDTYGEPVTSLALATVDAPPLSNARARGRNQEKIVLALKEWLRAHPDKVSIANMDLYGMCKAQGLDRKRRREVLKTFVDINILTRSVGGYRIHGEHL